MCDPAPYATGGGWYTLPGGERVHGAHAARERLREILDDPETDTRTEWRHVMRLVEDEDRHPSDEYLAQLIKTEGIPSFAEAYVARRFQRGPGARPFRSPEAWSAAGPFRLEQARALVELMHLRLELKAYETRDEGPAYAKTWRRTIPLDSLLGEGAEAEEFEVALVWVESRRIWKVRAPAEQARRIVAARANVSVSTLKDWEAEFRAYEGPLGEVF